MLYCCLYCKSKAIFWLFLIKRENNNYCVAKHMDLSDSGHVYPFYWNESLQIIQNASVNLAGYVKVIAVWRQHKLNVIVFFFKIEKKSFHFRAISIASYIAICKYHPVTRNNNKDLVLAIGRPCSPVGLGITGSFCKFLVRDLFAVRD